MQPRARAGFTGFQALDLVSDGGSLGESDRKCQCKEPRPNTARQQDYREDLGPYSQLKYDRAGISPVTAVAADPNLALVLLLRRFSGQ